jgi:hypothetical protein
MLMLLSRGYHCSRRKDTVMVLVWFRKPSQGHKIRSQK